MILNELNAVQPSITGDTQTVFYNKIEPKKKKLSVLPEYTVRAVREVVEENKVKAYNNKKLLGNLIMEDDLCIFFGHQNTGKSMFSYQFAEAIATGSNFFDMLEKPIVENQDNGEKKCYELVNTMPAQKVLYVDFEMSDTEIARRYVDKNEEDYNAYQHHENFKLMSFKSRAITDKMLYVKAIEKEVKESGIKVVIIDNMSMISMRGEEADFAANLINYLSDVKNDSHLTMILIAHTNKINPLEIKTINMLKGSSNFPNLVTSAFCISETTKDPALRYLKQFKCRTGERFFETGNVIEIEMKIDKSTGNKGFTFSDYANEYDEIKQTNYDKSEELTFAIQEQLEKSNISAYEIAKRLYPSYGEKSKVGSVVDEARKKESFKKKCLRIVKKLNRENDYSKARKSIASETPFVIDNSIVANRSSNQRKEIDLVNSQIVKPGMPTSQGIVVSNDEKAIEKNVTEDVRTDENEDLTSLLNDLKSVEASEQYSNNNYDDIPI